MTDRERDVHRLFSLDMTGDIDSHFGAFRMMYILGTWKLNSKVILSVSMMHPAIRQGTAGDICMVFQISTSVDSLVVK